MAALTNNTVASTYQSLLKTVDNGIVDSTLKNITDGLGNPTAISLDDQAVVISGSLAVSGSITTSNTVNSQMFMHPQTITSNVDIPAQHNAFLIGPTGFGGTVSVGSGSNLSIL